jgi:hypothetical protein
MRYHVLFVAADRPEPHYFSNFEADDDDQARRLLREKWPGEDDLFLVREEGVRLVRVPDAAARRAGFFCSPARMLRR